MRSDTSQRKRPSKQIIMFGLSLLLGGAGVFYSKQYIETQIAYYKGQFEKTEPMVSIVVPNKPLLRCLLYTSPSPRDGLLSRMPSSA